MSEYKIDPSLVAGNHQYLAGYQPRHFRWQVDNKVATITLNRPDRKNPLTFDSYAELRDLFHNLKWAQDVKAVVVVGEGGNFCSGGDVHEIIGPLVALKAPDSRQTRSPAWCKACSAMGASGRGDSASVKAASGSQGSSA